MGAPIFSSKSVVAAVLAAAMIGPSAFAADGALAPGKPAGVKPAQEIGLGTLLVAGAAIVVVTAIAITVADDDSGPTTSTTAATAP